MDLILRLSHVSSLLLLLCASVFSELRFCLVGYGPMRMKDTECQGGFVFKEPIDIDKVYCKYYAKTGNHTGRVLTAPTDICSERTDRIVENKGDALEDIRTFTYFLWEDYEEKDEEPGTFSPIDICTEECLGEWVDNHSLPDDPPIPDNFDPAKLSSGEITELNLMNRELFMSLYAVDEEETDKKAKLPQSETKFWYAVTDPNQADSDKADLRSIIQRHTIGGPLHPRRRKKSENLALSGPTSGITYLSQILHDNTQLMVIRVLAKSMMIMQDSCKPYITEQFLEQVLRGMVYISRRVEHSFLDLDQDLFMKVLKILDHCGLRFHQEFELVGNNCGGTEDEPLVEGISFTRMEEYWPHRLTGWSFRWGRWHPVIDTAWSAIDFTHNFCYESFMKDVTIMHVYITALEELFSDKARELWRLNPSVNNDNFWNNLMQVQDLNITMRNVDACQQAALKPSPFINHVPRPFLTSDELKRVASPLEVSPQKGRGWNQTIEAYWSWYERQGGFPSLSKEFGECFDDVHYEEEQTMINELKSNCP